MVEITQLLSEAGSLLAVGMGVVFTFLTMLVFCIQAMSAVVNRYFPEPVSADPPRARAAPTAQTDQAVVAAVTAAVHAYRSRHNQN